MLNPALELAGVATAVGASLHSAPVALSSDPLTGIAVAVVEPVHPEAVPHTLTVLAAVPTPSGPALDPVPFVLPVDPTPLVPPLLVEAIHPSPMAPPPGQLPFVDIPIAEEQHTLSRDLSPRVRDSLGVFFEGPDEPSDGEACARGSDAEEARPSEEAGDQRKGGGGEEKAVVGGVGGAVEVEEGGREEEEEGEEGIMGEKGAPDFHSAD